MIPRNIRREHVVKAIKEVAEVGIPKGRSSKKSFLKYNGKYYPPKYIISLANKYTNDKELDPSEFSGGKETNSFLKALGFDIVEVSSSEKPILKSFKKSAEIQFSKTRHDERCLKCKETIRKLLEKIYGKAEPNYRFQIGTHPEDFRNTPYYSQLKEIYNILQNHRGFREFVKTKTLPNCDFFVPTPAFIVEFDESQHFTNPRKIALEYYPEDLELGFDEKKWVTQCKKINAKDNDPPYRDEQRAWYDTLRDFLPVVKRLRPTVRIFSQDFQWCSLNPKSIEDLKKFKRMVNLPSPSYPANLISRLTVLHQEVKREYLTKFGNCGIGSQNNPKTLEWMRNRNNTEIEITIDQIGSFMQLDDDLVTNYKVLREIYAISPSFHESWFFDSHFKGCFKSIIKKRLGLKAYLTSKKNSTLDRTLQGITTLVLKYTILLENLMSSKLSQGLMDETVKLSTDVVKDIRDIEKISAIENYSKDAIVRLIPKLFGVVRYLLKSCKSKQLKSGRLLKGWLLYAPCSINEGPIFKRKASSNILDILSSIPSLEQKKIRDHLRKYFDIEEVIDG